MELVKELMLPIDQCVAVNQEWTIRDSIRLAQETEEQRRHNGEAFSHRAWLVIDDEDRVIGKLNQQDIVTNMEPRYRIQRSHERIANIFAAGLSPSLLKSMMERYSYWTETFDERCQQVLDVKVKDCMHTPKRDEFVQQSAPLELALHQLVIGRHQSLLVEEGDSIVGTLTLADVFQRLRRLCQDWGKTDP